ncbi:SAM-dependent methyltransferase [Herpetosiphon giganteus]|uniref:SAM-dependent methyltransferase n=1 Tax=Herpetosiphon giganteus TaxID=2029754 RepID=UPI0019584DDB|nr:methyltransferase domain-containing protein [Herpetosiphon giganteus]MBM7843488.1 cyclopropane fatty-acyl-phospholipid synthase-like methyltransferase [Herpetosiphon giganteus]
MTVLATDLSEPNPPSINDVETYYDAMGPFYKLIWGDSVHGGYWPAGLEHLSLPEAQEHLTYLMIEKTPIAAGQHMLDLGCGTGLPAIRMAAAKNCHVHGITVAHGQVAEAQTTIQAMQMQEKVQIAWGNAMELPFADGFFNAAWAFESIFHMPSRLTVLQEANRVLQAGSYLVLTDIVEVKPLSLEQKHIFYPAFQINTLTTKQGYLELFDQTGFEQLELIDLTAGIAKTLAHTKLGIEKKRAELEAIYPPPMLAMIEQTWPMVEKIYADYVRYVLIVARKRG